LGQFSKNYRTFYPKIVTKLSKIWSWDPGSGIRDPGSGKNLFRIPDPGVKKAPDPGSGSATLRLSPPPPPPLRKNENGALYDPRCTVPESVSSGRCIEDDHREVHAFHQLHHFCVAHRLVNTGKGAQQLLQNRKLV
jgi:hypothetical protein